MACFFYPLGCAVFIYLSHNLAFLKRSTFKPPEFSKSTRDSFYCSAVSRAPWPICSRPSSGPSLVSPDLANNALPLYFCRPFSRTEYVVGKDERAADSAFADHLGSRTGSVRDPSQPGRMGMDAGESLDRGRDLHRPLVWITVLSLIALALSAWVKWRIAAGALDPGRVFSRARDSARAINAVHAHQVRHADRFGRR